jgi:hypothetical protein
MLGRDADAGVAHREAEGGGILGARLGFDRDEHVASLGELEGVANEVDQNLTQPQRITHDGRRDRRVDVDQQPSPVDGSPQWFECLAHRVAIEKGPIRESACGLIFEKSRMSFRSGAGAGGRDRVQAVAPSVVSGVPRASSVSADDPVHRGPDLVVMLARNLALGPAGLHRLSRAVVRSVLTACSSEVRLHALEPS